MEKNELLERVREGLPIETLPPLKLIEDLGRQYPTETSKHKARFGIYECGFCGTHFKAQMTDVKSGNTKSCGCYNKALSYFRKKRHDYIGTKLYNSYNGMLQRTTNPKSVGYSNYGGRGIKVCDEWLKGFLVFKEWALENGYDENLTLDRMDNDGNYEPSNCRWVDRTIQARNQRMKTTNTSKYRAVSYHKGTDKFQLVICIGYKKIYLGLYKTAVEGAIAYNNYIIENNLEGFILNDIPDEFKDVIPLRLNEKGNQK